MDNGRHGQSPAFDQITFGTLYRYLGRRVYLFILFIMCVLFLLLLLLARQHSEIEYAQEQLTRNYGLSALSPTSSQAATSKTTTTTQLITEQRLVSSITKSGALTVDNYNLYLDGLYVRPPDEPSSGDISGSYDNGFSINADSVALGTDTVGNYLQSIVTGDGLAGGGSGEGAVITLSIEAGDGITVGPDGISLNIQNGGGLTINGGALALLDSCADGQILEWSALTDSWGCANDNAGAGSLLVRESDGTPSATPIAVLELGPATNSSEEFIVSDEGGGIARIRAGSAIALTNAPATITGNWTYSSEIVANGGLNCSNCVALGSETTGNYLAGLLSGSGLSVSGSGSEGATPTISLITTCADGQVLKWDDGGGSWGCADDADTTTAPLTVRETDGAPSVGGATTLEFGPASASADEFVISDQGGGTARIRTGTAIPLSNAPATITGSWTFTSEIVASGGISCTNCVALGSETTGDYLAGLLAGSGLAVSGASGEGSTPTVSLDSSLAIFKTIDASLGSDPVADGLTDTLSLSSGNGVTVTGSSIADSVTFDISLASGSGLAFSGGALSLQSCSDGQILKRAAGAWGCAADTDTNTVLASAYRQQLAGSDNVTVGASLTPLLTNGSGTAQSLSLTITSGNEISATATAEVSTSVAAGPTTYAIIRDDNADNDCATGGGDGTQIGGQVTGYIATVAQTFTTTFSFSDTAPSGTTNRYQLCASTSIGLGTVSITDRSLLLNEINL